MASPSMVGLFPHRKWKGRLVCEKTPFVTAHGAGKGRAPAAIPWRAKKEARTADPRLLPHLQPRDAQLDTPVDMQTPGKQIYSLRAR